MGEDNKLHRCFRLLKGYKLDYNVSRKVKSQSPCTTEASDDVGEGDDLGLTRPVPTSSIGQGKLLFDIPLDIQIHKLVAAGGDKGLSASVSLRYTSTRPYSI
jgi:hypothetical protein